MKEQGGPLPIQDDNAEQDAVDQRGGEPEQLPGAQQVPEPNRKRDWDKIRRDSNTSTLVDQCYDDRVLASVSLEY